MQVLDIKNVSKSKWWVEKDHIISTVIKIIKAN